MNARVPAEVFSPGEILKAELHKRGWTQTELSEILGRPPRVVSEVISAKRAITPETAKGLAAALGTSAELWMNLESSYQLSKHQFETSKVKRRARLYGKFPVKEMIRRGWVQVTKDMDRLEREFSRYFSISSIDEAPKFAHAAKKHLYLDAPQLTQLAWLIRAEQIAKRGFDLSWWSFCPARNWMAPVFGLITPRRRSLRSRYVTIGWIISGTRSFTRWITCCMARARTLQS